MLSTSRCITTPQITPPTLGLAFPQSMLVGVAGDQGWGCNSAQSYVPWTNPSSGTARTAVLKIGRWNYKIVGGTDEGSNSPSTDWTNGNLRFRDNFSSALSGSAGYSIPENSQPSRMLPPFYYANVNELATSGAIYGIWYQLCNLKKWWLYQSAGGLGTITPSAYAAGYNLVNFAHAYPSAIGSTPADQSVCGHAYGGLLSGQGPAETFARYIFSKLFGPNVDPDFAGLFNSGMLSSRALGIMLDNVFPSLNIGGNVPDSYCDAVNSYPGNSYTYNTVLARGHYKLFTLLALLRAAQGQTHVSFGNFTEHADQYLFGSVPLSGPMNQVLGGCLLESTLGAGGSSWEWWQNPAPDPTGWNNWRKNIYQGTDLLTAPKACGIGVRVPGGSRTASWNTGSASYGTGKVLATVSANTSLEYQLARYGMGMACLAGVPVAFGVDTYDWSLPRYYEELGDDSLTICNVPQGWLGQPLDPRPTHSSLPGSGAYFGIWLRRYAGGLIAHNPRGNGTQTVTQSQLSAIGYGNYKRITGTQQPSINSGSTLTAQPWAALDGDSLFMLPN